MVISQLVPFARASGFSAQNAAFAITIGAIGSAAGRFLSGWMSDHLGRLRTLRGIVVLSMLATPSLYLWREEPLMFYVLLFFVYYCYGTQLSVYTALAGDFYGTKYLATNYGVLLLAWGFAGVLGPPIGSRVRQHRDVSARVLRIRASRLRRARTAERCPPASRCACAGGSLKSEVRSLK
jgi:OFA family oxalate/formate antiporter-like MFS transporter